MNRRRVSWSDLPPELLSKIAECLERRLDIQHFRAVCKSWESSIPLSFLTSKNILSPHFPHPLATSTRSWLDSSNPRSLVLVASSTFLIRSTLNPRLQPWLFTAEELHPGKLFVSLFLSPIAIKKLPADFSRSLDLSHIQVSEMAAFHRLRFVDDPCDMFRMKKFPDFNNNRVILFVDPSCSKDPPTTGDCTAMVLHHKGSICAIRLKDEQELEVSYRGTYLGVTKFDDIVNFKEKVYAIDRRGRAYSMDYHTLSMLPLIENPSLDNYLSGKKKRLVVSSDHQDLYLICIWSRFGTYDEVGFNVYKLDERESKWDKVEGIGDDKILFVTFDGSFFASTQDFQGWKGNCIVFFRSCFTSHGISPQREYCDSLCVYNFKDDDYNFEDDDHQPFASYYSKVFWEHPSWLSSNACLSNEETEEDEESQSVANSQDIASPTSSESEPMVVEQFVDAPSTSAARGSLSRDESPSSSPSLVHELTEQTLEISSPSAARDRLTGAEISSLDRSEFEPAEPIIEFSPESTTSRATRTSAMNELEHAAEKVSNTEILREGNNITHPVSSCRITSTTQSKPSDDSTVKFNGFDIKSNLLQTLQNIWSKHGNLMEDIIIRNHNMVSTALESLATAVRILEETSVRYLNDSQAEYLTSTLSDLQCMHFKVGWLVPYVEKAVQLHKCKPLMEAHIELLSRQATVVVRRTKLIEELEELDKLEHKLKEDVANATKLIPFSEKIDIDQPVGWGFN